MTGLFVLNCNSNFFHKLILHFCISKTRFIYFCIIKLTINFVDFELSFNYIDVTAQNTVTEWLII
jgi:hypothetical protein